MLESKPPAPHDEEGRRVMWAHSGVLAATLAILKDIQGEGVLAAALERWSDVKEERDEVLRRLPSERAKSVAKRAGGAFVGWRVVLTGHSLGAGVAALLGPLLREQFPNLRCWAFAPPGGLMSPQAASLTRDYCVSVVHAKDMIPRLAVASMEQLVQ
ncbi:Sn1-specific diacylglycerol lipase alpha, partial [Tetrabaena socialis]